MKGRSDVKLTNLTTAEIERLLDRAAAIRDEVNDAMVMIGAGRCERLADPMLYARRCMSFTRTFTDATSHFLARAELQERTR